MPSPARERGRGVVMCWGPAPTFAPERIGPGAVSPKGCPATQRELCGEAAQDLPPPLRQPCVADITGRSDEGHTELRQDRVLGSGNLVDSTPDSESGVEVCYVQAGQAC